MKSYFLSPLPFVIFIMLILSSCKEDETVQMSPISKEDVTIKRAVDENDQGHLTELVSKALAQYSGNNSARSMVQQAVNTSSGVVVENLNDSTLTWSLDYNEFVTLGFINFVIRENTDGVLYSHFLKYEAEHEWMSRNNGKFMVNEFTGGVTSYSLDRQLLAKADIVNGLSTTVAYYSGNSNARDDCTGNGGGSGDDGGGNDGGGSDDGGGHGGGNNGDDGNGEDTEGDDNDGGGPPCLWEIIEGEWQMNCDDDGPPEPQPHNARILPCDSPSSGPNGGGPGGTGISNPGENPVDCFPGFVKDERGDCILACQEEGYVLNEEGNCLLECGEDMVPDGEGGCVILNLNMDDQGYRDLTECEKELVQSYPHHLITLSDNRDLAHQKTIEIFGAYGDGNGYNDCGDAFRHAFFNALNTKKLGNESAKAWGDAHECETPPDKLKEKEMDLLNNEIGRSVANEAPYAVPNTLVDLILVEMQLGNLKYLSPLGSGNVLIYNSELINTADCF